MNVIALRFAIKATETRFEGINATDLILYHVSVPYTPQLADNVAGLELDNLKMDPLDKLEVFFTDDPPGDHVHVVIKIPSGAWVYVVLSSLR